MAAATAASDQNWVESYTGMSSDNIKGLVLALSSSFFIGASFIVKKKGLKKAGASGVRAGVGGYSYLYEPLWWVGMIAMVVGEVANFAAYAFAPAILVTPLVLYLHISFYGKDCIYLAFLAVLFVLWDQQQLCSMLPKSGKLNQLQKYGIWQLSQVMGVKALGIALKLTFSGMNQLIYPQTWLFAIIVVSCVITQISYLNKALDTFNTAVVSPIYYVMFTSLTILASVIMFKDWDRQHPTQILTEMCGFVTILSGTFLLHRTKDMADGYPGRLPKHADEDGYPPEGTPLRSTDSFRLP
ncbi:hypothetical protein ZIOFF_065445 [Zingiber officinale]|uniref:Probable magnesium transporter n=1 Tax=Zingiber officinale TaxID=94328 RepID=A0A8J5KH36_ZINOF|nr:hypothetical protein ZIOFF_065445 [Zingiber officinale]